MVGGCVRLIKLWFFATLLVGLSIQVNAQSAKSSEFKCPDWLLKGSANLPLCPEGKGQILLPETYPIAALVVSDSG